jgi:hypothetical protein
MEPDLLRKSAVMLPQMPGQEFRDLVESFRQGEFSRAVSRVGDDLQRAFDAGNLKGMVQSLALNQRNDVISVSVNGVIPSPLLFR